jgi:Spy/CpxP family protein refolding chaperone
MKVQILALAAIMAIAPSVATAQSDKDKSKDKSSQEKPRDKDGRWGGRKGSDDDARKSSDDDSRKGDARWGGQRRLLGGIQLTDAQKTSIKAIHAKYEPRMVAIRDTIRASKKAGTTTAANDPIRVRAQSLVTQERAEIRAVLTAEQQVRFDQNVAKFSDRKEGRGKRGDRGDRGDRGSRGDRSR